MSLDVYLYGPETKQECTCTSCGNSHECVRCDRVYDANITHNLAKMAEAAGIYLCLWRPEEIHITTASELIAPLSEGLSRLQSDPDRFRELNPSNGWGNYENLVLFVSQYLTACRENPDATVEVLR